MTLIVRLLQLYLDFKLVKMAECLIVVASVCLLYSYDIRKRGVEQKEDIVRYCRFGDLPCFVHVICLVVVQVAASDFINCTCERRICLVSFKLWVQATCCYLARPQMSLEVLCLQRDHVLTRHLFVKDLFCRS